MTLQLPSDTKEIAVQRRRHFSKYKAASRCTGAK